MEPNIPITFKEKVQNAITNVQQMMASDKRILFGVIGIGILVILFITFAAMTLFGSGRNSLVTDQTPLPLSPVNKNTSLTKKKFTKNATLTLVLKNPTKKTYRVGETIGIIIVGNTNGIPLRGYDAVFRFDSNMVSFGTQKNLFSSFTFLRRIRGNWILVTGMQPAKSFKSISLQDTKLAEIAFTAKNPGNAFFPMSYIPDSTSDSNLIDFESNDMLSSATGIVVQIVP